MLTVNQLFKKMLAGLVLLSPLNQERATLLRSSQSSTIVFIRCFFKTGQTAFLRPVVLLPAALLVEVGAVLPLCMKAFHSS